MPAAPRAASSRAVASPRPCVPPVIAATLPANCSKNGPCAIIASLGPEPSSCARRMLGQRGCLGKLAVTAGEANDGGSHRADRRRRPWPRCASTASLATVPLNSVFSRVLVMAEGDHTPVAWSFGEGDALQEIASWIEARPGWQQQALRWLLDAEQLADAQLDELLKMALQQGAAPEPVRQSELRMAGSATQTVALLAVDEVADVNALAVGQHLTFGQTGLTVNYGRNGAGKSGYARILKHACRARRPSREGILPNIDAPTPGTPTARIKCSVNGTNQYVGWTQGQQTDEILSAVSVFDSSTAPIHVDEVNEVAYTPYPLELLERLASASIALRERASAMKGGVESQTPEVLKQPSTSPETSAGKLLASLSGQTAEEQVRSLAGLMSGERARMDALRRDLAGDPRKVARELGRVRTELLAAKDKIAALSHVVSPGSRCGALRSRSAARCGTAGCRLGGSERFCRRAARRRRHRCLACVMGSGSAVCH